MAVPAAACPKPATMKDGANEWRVGQEVQVDPVKALALMAVLVDYPPLVPLLG